MLRGEAAPGDPGAALVEEAYAAGVLRQEGTEVRPGSVTFDVARARALAVVLVDPVADHGVTATAFRDAGVDATVLVSLEAAVAHVRVRTPAAVVVRLDAAPVLDARAARALRALAERCAVVIAIAPGLASGERLQAYALGCTEVLTHAPPPHELAAHVRALNRLVAATAGPRAPLRVGRLQLDPERGTVFRDGAPVHLRPKEHALLDRFVARRGAVVTRAELLADVWGYQPDLATRTLDHHVFRLRRHVEVDPRRPTLLVTVARVGYRLLHEPLAPLDGACLDAR